MAPYICNLLLKSSTNHVDLKDVIFLAAFLAARNDHLEVFRIIKPYLPMEDIDSIIHHASGPVLVYLHDEYPI